MTRPVRGADRSRRTSLWGPIALTAILLPIQAISQVPSSPAPIPDVFEDVESADSVSERPTPRPKESSEVQKDQDALLSQPEAVARFTGEAVPGLELSISALESKGQQLQYRWVQTSGTPVTLDDTSNPQPRFLVPRGVDRLDFLLIVSNSTGIDTARLSVPVSNPLPGPRPTRLVANAGDDQIGLVGREVTLNGLRSEPRGKIGYRWIQVGGPTVRLKIEDGYTFTFIPPAPGIYRFALVVASASEISEPSFVGVTVASSLPGVGTSSFASLRPIDELARSGLASIEGGSELAIVLAECFDSIAMRVDLYHSFSDLTSEMGRRLDELIPSEPARRNAWIQQIFNPLTSRIIEEMLHEGLDLRQADAHSKALTANQRARLAELFRSIALGFRGSTPPG